MSNIVEKEWPLIEAIALRLGVRADTVRKWRERSHVPYKWRIPVINLSEGRITLADFDDEL